VKRLTLVRHGNADWKDPRMADFQRPLNKRGSKEVESMARRLRDLDLIPDLLIASTAERTRHTADLLAKVLAPKRVQSEERLYLAPVADVLHLIQQTGPLVAHLMIVGHNPGLSELAKILAPDPSVSELTTAAACSVVFKSDRWTELTHSKIIEARYESPPSRGFRLWA
jgi:phosphohistidine phosphatase